MFLQVWPISNIVNSISLPNEPLKTIVQGAQETGLLSPFPDVHLDFENGQLAPLPMPTRASATEQLRSQEGSPLFEFCLSPPQTTAACLQHGDRNTYLSDLLLA